jgi:signal transduction histidine kinase
MATEEHKNDELRTRREEAMEQLCGLDGEDDKAGDQDTLMFMRLQEILKEKHGSVSASSLGELEDCFNSFDQRTKREEENKEFALIEDFVLAEQTLGSQRRSDARKLEASEERGLAIEIAKLKIKLTTEKTDDQRDLQRKISDAERAYLNRKMVFAKAAQVTNTECRLQFSRVRGFFESLHKTRQEVLRQQHKRTLKFQAIMHRFRGTDARVVTQDQQTNKRVYQNKKANLNELHLAQTLEEAVYLDSMMDLLDSVQAGKETAARELFELHVSNLMAQREANSRRAADRALLRASTLLEIATVVALYTGDDAEDMEHEGRVRDKVDSMERRKDFYASSDNRVLSSVSKLYDTVLWSVANSQLGFLYSGSSMYSSSPSNRSQQFEEMKTPAVETDDTTVEDDSTEEDLQARLAPSAGKMHMKQLTQKLRTQERVLIKKHNAEVKMETHKHGGAVFDLKGKHQAIVDRLLEECHIERQNLRQAIYERMDLLARSQEESIEQLRQKDVQLMQEALRAEDKRLAKAQELVSAQVFHEVRNALSSVIAMKDITSFLKIDATLSPFELLSSMDDMLGQINAVVSYAMKMLNSILIDSKINSGVFQADSKPFDLQEVVTGVTRMQFAKVSHGVKMSFVPAPHPWIALSDKDMVERIMATLICNSIKFTSAGAVQPFICPLEDVLSCATGDGGKNGESKSYNSVGVLPSADSLPPTMMDTSTKAWPHDDVDEGIIGDVSSTAKDGDFNHQRNQQDKPQQVPLNNVKMRMVAVGVADTGPGLHETVLQSAENGILTSKSKTGGSHGAQNSGFGLYHSQLQAKSLHTTIQLSTLEHCRNLLNKDMLNAMVGAATRTLDVPPAPHNDESDVELNLLSTRPTTTTRDSVPGPGTIIYFTIPVYEDIDVAQEAVLVSNNDAELIMSSQHQAPSGSFFSKIAGEYRFDPRPSPKSTDGHFRIMVADDVLMLRKGMVHTIGDIWGTHFPDCPVAISTACSAEDLLRAAASQPFDLIICDHMFRLDLSQIRPLAPEELATSGRPSVVYGDETSSREEIRKRFSHFFENERFTIEEGDGSLMGIDAVTQLAETTNPPFPTPVLMLLSGHKLEVAPSVGVIVVLKPLKKTEFVALFEAHAQHLLNTGRCVLDDSVVGSPGISGSGSSLLVNRHGSQLFVRLDQEDPDSRSMELKRKMEEEESKHKKAKTAENSDNKASEKEAK